MTDTMVSDVEVIGGKLAANPNAALLVKAAQAKVAALLDPFKDHRTYGAAISELDRVLRLEGFSAAMAKGRRIAEAYEEVYLREYYEPSNV